MLDTRLPRPRRAGAPCHRRCAAARPACVTRAVLVPSAAAGQVRLDGGSGDWDVALFDAAGHAVAAAASPDAQEVASGWALEPGTLTLQACRRAGAGPSGDRHARRPSRGDVGAGARGRAAAGEREHARRARTRTGSSRSAST